MPAILLCAYLYSVFPFTQLSQSCKFFERADDTNVNENAYDLNIDFFILFFFMI